MPATVSAQQSLRRNRLSTDAFVKRLELGIECRQNLIDDGPDRAQRVRGRYPRLHVDIGEPCPDAASDPRIPISRCSSRMTESYSLSPASRREIQRPGGGWAAFAFAPENLTTLPTSRFLAR